MNDHHGEINQRPLLVQGGKEAIVSELSQYHPVLIEGMGPNDPRPASQVADNVVLLLNQHWGSDNNNHKPKLVIIQGDPLHEQGISAITLKAAEKLNVSRGLVCLDEAIMQNHAQYADRQNVSVEFRYSDMAQVLPENKLRQLEALVDQMMNEKNQALQSRGKPPLQEYYRHFALLQEVTKAACRHVCGDLTVAQTQKEIGEFTVRSFYKAGVQLGLVDAQAHMVFYEFDD